MSAADDQSKLQSAISLHQSGNISGASKLYRELIEKDGRNSHALHFLGIIEAGAGNMDQAKALLSRSLAIQPANLQFIENYATVLFQAGEYAPAIAVVQKGLLQAPDKASLLYLSAVSLFKLNRFPESLAQFDKLLSLQPRHPIALNERGAVLTEMKRYDAALESIDRALAINPRYAEAHVHRGNLLFDLRRHGEAFAAFDQALAIAPNLAEAWLSRGKALKELNKLDEARTCYDKTLALQPDNLPAQFGRCMAELPILYESEKEIATRRSAYETRLKMLCDAADRSPHHAALVRAIGASLPFYLAYQGYNDRELQALYGSMICRAMARYFPAASMPPPPKPDEPVRLGIVSGFFRQHTVWKLITAGWITQLDRRRFRVFGYSTGFLEDEETRRAATHCERFVHGLWSVEQYRREILADAPHVLLYPELGMDAITVQLAAQRLAPVQCMSWGHPSTSGCPTLDYFLSSELMEPPDAADHYTEQLIRLPNLSIYYQPFEPPPLALTREQFGLRSNAIVYWSGQSLFKYLPQFDWIYPAIAKIAADCQFVFIEYAQNAAVTDQFRQRLDRAFSAAGLNASDHCVILPRLTAAEFVFAPGLCDVVLDSVGWSGGNTTLETLLHNLPIVTMAAPLMRGRHTFAFLKRMGIEDTIAQSVHDYVTIAVRLAGDAAWRADLSARIAQNKDRLYRDQTCIAALEDFLDRAVRGTRN
jgi:predicted O-linked N-acetylglucosamine transferase (SPINDLY family)